MTPNTPDATPINPALEHIIRTIEQSGSSSQARPDVVFAAYQVLIHSLLAVNNLLQAISQDLLPIDVSKDQLYANMLQGIQFQTISSGMSSLTRSNIQTQNNQKLALQTAIQARYKAHQSLEQIDVQAATSTSTQSQQITSMLDAFNQALMGVVSKITQMR